jgi:hypothetical protein
MFKCLLFNVGSDKLKGRSLGSHRIAHFLRENSWDAEVIDYYQFWNLDQLKELCKLRITADTKFLGFSFLFTEEIGNCQQFWEWLKSSYADIPIIVGSAQKFTLSSPHVDYNICGYGELALLELIDYLFSNGSCPKFTLHMNSGKNISANESYPAFPMDQLTVKYEDRDFIDEEEWLGVEFARGCMFSCDFCNFPVLGVKGDYSRDASDFELQIQDAYDRFGVKNYYVADETFNDRTEKISKFADVIEKLSFDPYFTGYIRADLMINRPRDREELLRMNFLGHHYGIETFHHRAGKAIGKGLDPEKIKQGLLDCKRYFQTHVGKRYRGNISLIVGLPYEPITSIEASEKWMLDNWQGQSFIAYGLYIPVSEYEKESKISMDYQKYGYRSMTKEEIVISQSRRSDLLNSVVKKSLDDKAQLIWVNDQMDIFDALEISTRLEKMRMRQDVDFRLGAFELALAGAGTLDDRLDITIANYPLGIKSVQQRLADIYIEKKLSL